MPRREAQIFASARRGNWNLATPFDREACPSRRALDRNLHEATVNALLARESGALVRRLLWSLATKRDAISAPRGSEPMRTKSILTPSFLLGLVGSGLVAACSAAPIHDDDTQTRDDALTAVTPTPGCVSAGDKPAALATVGVPALPTGDGEIAVRDGVLVVDVRAASRDATTFELVGTLRANGETSTQTIAAGDASSSGAAIRVPLDAFGLRGFADGSLRLELRARTADGRHSVAYAPNVLLRRDAAGQLYAARTHGEGAYRFTGGLGLAAPPGDPSEAVAFPPPDGRWHFCLAWEITAVDSGFGEDFHAGNQPVRARGAKVKVQHGGQTLFDANADAEGCVHFASPEQGGFDVTVRSEAMLDGLGMKAFMPPTNLPEKIAEWSFSVDPQSPPKWLGLVVDAGDQQIASNLIAFTSHTIHRVASNTTPGFFKTGTIGVHARVLGGDLCSEGCKSGSDIFLKPEVTDEKFGVSHEVGHWLQGQLATSQLAQSGGNYDDNDAVAACRFVTPDDGPGKHAMRSREKEAAAFTEGVGHFVAALAWNSHEDTDGFFRYYKATNHEAYVDMKNADWVIDLSPDGDIPVGGQNDWYHTKCTVLPAQPAARSVELDWLRFLWNLRTDAPSSANGFTPKPSHTQLFGLIKAATLAYPYPNGSGVYAKMNASIGQPGITIPNARWTPLAQKHGVRQQ